MRRGEAVVPQTHGAQNGLPAPHPGGAIPVERPRNSLSSRGFRRGKRTACRWGRACPAFRGSSPPTPHPARGALRNPLPRPPRGCGIAPSWAASRGVPAPAAPPRTETLPTIEGRGGRWCAPRRADATRPRHPDRAGVGPCEEIAERAAREPDARWMRSRPIGLDRSAPRKCRSRNHLAGNDLRRRANRVP